MSAPSVLLLAAVAATLAAWQVPGLGDLALVSVPSALAALWLLLRAPHRPRRNLPPQHPPGPTPVQTRPIVIDGSNVLYWKDNAPSLTTLQTVVNHLKRQGFAPGVVFDANAGYLLTGRYVHDGGLARLLDLPEDQVLVVAKGTPADPMILHIARSLQAPVLSNDRYRDWLETYPEARKPGHVIRGGFRPEGLWLDLPEPAQAQAS